MQKQRTQLPKRNRKIQQIKIPEYMQKPQEANAALIYPMAQLLRAAAATGATAWAASKVNPETTKSVVDKAASYVQAAPVAIYNTYRTLTKPTGQGRVNNTAIQSGQTVVNDATAVQRPTIAYTRPHSTAIKMSDIGVLLNRDKKVNTDTKPVGSEQTATAATSTASAQPEQNPEDKKPEEKKQEEGTQQGEQTTQQKPELPKKGRWQRAREWAGNKIAGNTKPTTEAAAKTPENPTGIWNWIKNNPKKSGLIVTSPITLDIAGNTIADYISPTQRDWNWKATNTVLSIPKGIIKSFGGFYIGKPAPNIQNNQQDSTNTQKGDTAVINQKPNSNVEVTSPTKTQNLGNSMRGTLH